MLTKCNGTELRGLGPGTGTSVGISSDTRTPTHQNPYPRTRVGVLAGFWRVSIPDHVVRSLVGGVGGWFGFVLGRGGSRKDKTTTEIFNKVAVMVFASP